MASHVSFKHISLAVGDRQILRDISFSVEEGESITIVGPSGSGKSTILKLASSLVSPTGGTIFFHGKPIESYAPTEYRQRVAYCFQQPYLFGQTVRGNLAFPFTMRGRSVDTKRIKELFDLFHMNLDLLEKANTELSGGEMQRICLIRSLLVAPEVLLLDEVTSALDTENTEWVERGLMQLHKEGLTLLQVTHNPEQSLRMGQRRMTVKDGLITDCEVLHGEL